MEEGLLGRSPGLQDMPTSIVALILDHMLNNHANNAAGSGSSVSASAALRSAVQLAFSCKALLEAVAAAEQLWQQQCHRLGWRSSLPLRFALLPARSLDWLGTLPPGTTAWQYFCRRMAVRHHLRRQLRTLARFLDPISAAAIRPAAPVQAVREVEAALQAPLPWELYELYRFCDGQDRERGGIQFLHEARLLSLGEALTAAQERQGPMALSRAFAALLVVPPAAEPQALPQGTAQQAGGCCSGGGSSGNSGSSSQLEAALQTVAAAAAMGRPTPCGNSSSSSIPAGNSSGAGACGMGGGGASSLQEGPGRAPLDPGEPPEVLLPFSDELRGARRYCMDLQGRVWLSSGWHTHPCAPSLSALLRRILT